MSRFCLLILSCLVLAACGLKGPLYLPNRTQPASVPQQSDGSASTSASAPASASRADTDADKEAKDKATK